MDSGVDRQVAYFLRDYKNAKKNTMKLKKGAEIQVINVVVKSHGKSLNSGFLNYKHHPHDLGVSELPGAWIVTAQASALDCTICRICGRLYNFGIPGAKAQCECKGETVNEESSQEDK